MKKLLIGLLALGLVFSFSVPVMASDLSVSGAYRIRGWLDSNSPLYDENGATDAYFDQRFRVQPKFTVVEGLSATIRFDCLEGTWGGDLRAPDGYGGDSNFDANVQFDKAYVTFLTKYGQVEAGFKSTNLWGLDFGNTEDFVGEIDFLTKLNENIALFFRFEKDVEQDSTYNNRIQDEDKDAYIAAGVYKAEGMEAGLLYKGVRDMTDPAEKTVVHVLSPYVKANLAGAYVEGQIYWATGDKEVDGGDDVDLEDILIYLMAKADVGPGYVGAMFAYAQGEDDYTDNDSKGGVLSGSDWNPCHILFNDTQPSSLGTNAKTGAALNNAYLWQVFAGMSPMENLALSASLTYAYADEKTYYEEGVKLIDTKDDDYGTEVDITASYKIYDNLDYTVGFGYLFAGDFYKGDDSDYKVDDTYLLMNKLQVNF